MKSAMNMQNMLWPPILELQVILQFVWNDTWTLRIVDIYYLPWASCFLLYVLFPRRLSVKIISCRYMLCVSS